MKKRKRSFVRGAILVHPVGFNEALYILVPSSTHLRKMTFLCFWFLRMDLYLQSPWPGTSVFFLGIFQNMHEQHQNVTVLAIVELFHIFTDSTKNIFFMLDMNAWRFFSSLFLLCAPSPFTLRTSYHYFLWVFNLTSGGADMNRFPHSSHHNAFTQHFIDK